MTDRRNFLRPGGLAVGALAIGGPLHAAGSIRHDLCDGTPGAEPAVQDRTRALMLSAVEAARAAGASFSDARIARYRQNFVVTREQQIVQVVDTDSMGCG